MISPHHKEFLRKKRQQKVLRYQIAIFSFLLLLGIAAYLSHMSRFRINHAVLSGGVLVTQNDVESASLNFLQGSYVWMFPKNNSFIYPKASLQNYLRKTFPRIDAINISLKNLKTLEVAITERKPVGQWCDGNQSCYFLDSNGMIFAPAPQFSGNAYFKYYGLVATDTPVGNSYLTGRFSDINDFIASVQNMNLNPAYLVAKDNGEFSLVMTDGSQIYFDTIQPLSKTAENLKALLRTPNLLNVNGGYVPFEYIDLRFGNKLYYKLK